MNASKNNNQEIKPPNPNEVELVVFGPGVGESILVHLGQNEWFLIDSCILPGHETPAAIWYLNEIGVDPQQAIKGILATHWHDDHIRGISEIARGCPNAVFSMSAALGCDEFFEIVLDVASNGNLVSKTSSAHEMSQIIDLWDKNAINVQFAHHATRLFGSMTSTGATVDAISPASFTVANQFRNLAKRLLTEGTVKRFKQLEANDLSVAAHIQVGQVCFLMGADLENTTNARHGWKAVLQSNVSRDKGHLFKVSHHGSDNGDHPEIWTALLNPEPISIVTPYTKLRNPMPTAEQIQRLRGCSTPYIPTWPISRRPDNKGTLNRTIKATARNHHIMNSDAGFVRVRYDIRQTTLVPQVALFGAANEAR